VWIKFYPTHTKRMGSLLSPYVTSFALAHAIVLDGIEDILKKRRQAVK